MIFNLFIYLITVVVSGIFGIFTGVTLASIPVIGTTISSILLTMVRTYNAFADTFPYARVGFQMLIFVIIPFEILMLSAKFLLGHRLPSNHN